MNASESILLLSVPASYALGCINAGYYYVQWRARQDIRCVGSGNAGATNVGRFLGPHAFVVTFLLDFAKGAVVANLGSLDPAAAPVLIWAVLAGHIWPVQLRFRGGKGVATALGALMIYDIRILLLLGGLFAPILLSLRRFVVSGLLSFTACAVAVLLLQYPWRDVICISVVTLILLVSHRRDLRGWRRCQIFVRHGQSSCEKIDPNEKAPPAPV